MSSRAQPKTEKSYRALLLALAAPAAVAAQWFGYPAVLAGWLMVMLSTWFDVPPPPSLLLGKNPSQPEIAVNDPEYAKKMRIHRRWRSVKWGLFLNRGMLPGKPLSLWWMVAVSLSVTALALPVTAADPISGMNIAQWGPWVNALCAFSLLTAIPTARRETFVEGDVLPEATVADLAAPFKTEPHTVVAPGGGAFAVVFVLAAMFSSLADPRFSWVLFTVAPVAAGLLAIYPAASKRVREHFLEVAESRVQWWSRFMAMKVTPPHRLLDHAVYGPDPENPDLRSEIFEADARAGGSARAKELMKTLDATLGGYRGVIAPVEAQDSSGQVNIPGSTHPNRFEILSYPPTGLPDISAAGSDPELVRQALRAAAAHYSLDNGVDVRPTQIQRISAEAGPDQEHGDLWAVQFSGFGFGEALRDAALTFAAPLGVFAAGSHREAGGEGVMFLGDFDAPLAEDSPYPAQLLEDLFEEADWNAKWAAIQKTGVNPPTPKFANRQKAHLPGRGNAPGPLVENLPFVCRHGMSPEADFFPLAPKLGSMMVNSTMATMTGFPRNDGRPGSRHDLAFSLIWSMDQGVPTTPDEVVPGRSERDQKAQTWVLAGMLNDAFRKVKLDQPELVRATSLTPPEGERGRRQNRHIWKLDVRLYGATTMGDVRDKARRIQDIWASAWLRVTEAADGCTIYVGEKPSKVKFRSDRYMKEVDVLDWEQVFLDSKMASSAGYTPRLVKSELLKNNENVKVLTFDSRGTGLTFEALRGSVSKLSANSGMGWIDPIQVEGDPQSFVLRCSESDPMPRSIPHDWEMMSAGDGVSFGQVLEGDPIAWSPKVDPHLLLIGGTGSGKSVTIQSVLTSALLHGWQCHVIDIPKQAADFQFAAPWLDSVSITYQHALAVVRHLYAEVTERKAANARHSVGSYRDLPEDVRPPHVLLVVDEFTSTIIPDEEGKPTGDPELDMELDRLKAKNAQLREIGNTLGKIMREARSAGVSVLLAGQALKADTLSRARMPNDVKDNMSRAVQGKLTAGQWTSSLKDPYSAPSMGEEVPSGRGLLESSLGFTRYQSWYHPAEGRHLAEGLTDRLGPGDPEQFVDVSGFMPPEIEYVPAVEDVAADPNAPVETEFLEPMSLDFDWDTLDEGEDEDAEAGSAVAGPPLVLPPLPVLGDVGEPEVVARDEPELDEGVEPAEPVDLEEQGLDGPELDEVAEPEADEPVDLEEQELAEQADPSDDEAEPELDEAAEQDEPGREGPDSSPRSRGRRRGWDSQVIDPAKRRRGA